VTDGSSGMDAEGLLSFSRVHRAGGHGVPRLDRDVYYRRRLIDAYSTFG
jgi:hypothetical protein